jgi:methylmalonyl-CoA mutase
MGCESDEMPVFGTIASQFNDPGMNTLYKAIMDKVVEKTNSDLKSTFEITREMSEKIYVIPPHRTRYLSESAENRHYDETALTQEQVAQNYMVFSKETVSGKVPVITKSGIDDASVLPTAIESEKEGAVEDKIFLNLLLNQFDKVKWI